jgi:hypothetical protein
MESSESAKRYNSVLEIIDKRLIPDEGAKKARGEVFTPLCLVREMLFGLRKSALESGKTQLCDPLDKSPKPKNIQGEIWGINEEGNFFDDDERDRVGGIPLEVWRNPNTKWLDPANGIGNFPVVAFYMLDYQLGKHGPSEFKGDKNKDKRRKHIVENMLYMIELNKGNVNTSRKIFQKIVPGVEANICCANTLKLSDIDLKKQLDINRFDVVMGNPPFNEGGTKHHEDRGFYTKFIKYGYNLLNKDRYLIFVHPPNYHRIDKDDPKKGIVVKELFNENNLLFLRIIANTKDYFDVQIAIDYYILQKSNNKSEAIILDKHNILTTDIDISIFETVPNFGFNIIKKLVKLQNKNGKFVAKIGRDSDKHSSRKELFTNGKFKIIHLINEDGIRIKLSNTPHKYQNINKVIINGLGVPYVLDDKNKEYGTSEAPNYILEPSRKEKIFLFSKLFQYLNWGYRIQGNKNDRYFFDIMPDLNKFNYTDENTMIKALGLEKDLEEINKYNVPEFEHIEKIEKAGEGKAAKVKTARAIKAKKGGAPTSRFTQTRKNRKQ